jgi:hypothetical protein
VTDETLQSDQNKRCFECDQPATYQHHVVPESLGGTKTVPLCGHCHPKAHGENGYWSSSELAKKRLLRMRAARQWTGGHIPYGYKLTSDRRLTWIPEEWQVLKTILVWQLLGLSFGKICTQLNEMGTPTKTGSAPWTRCTVKQIVRRRGKQLWRNKKTRAPL